MIKYFAPTIAAGSTGVDLEISGKYFRILTASEALSIKGFDSQGRQNKVDATSIQPGIELGPYDPRFHKLHIETTSGNAGSCTMYISDEPTNIATVAGTVNIIDTRSPRYIALLQQGYVAPINIAAGGTGKFSQFQLRNPAASGFNAIVTLMDLAGGAATTAVNIERVATAADLTNAIPVNNRYLGGGVGHMVASWNNQATVQLGNTILGIGNAPAAGVYEPDLYSGPIIIPPGQALQWEVSTANQPLAGFVNYDELAVNSF